MGCIADAAVAGVWAEYSLGDRDNRARVIVCHMVAAEVVYLVARTAIHDHGGLNKIVADFQPQGATRRLHFGRVLTLAAAEAALRFGPELGLKEAGGAARKPR